MCVCLCTSCHCGCCALNLTAAVGVVRRYLTLDSDICCGCGVPISESRCGCCASISDSRCGCGASISESRCGCGAPISDSRCGCGAPISDSCCDAVSAGGGPSRSVRPLPGVGEAELSARAGSATERRPAGPHWRHPAGRVQSHGQHAGEEDTAGRSGLSGQRAGTPAPPPGARQSCQTPSAVGNSGFMVPKTRTFLFRATFCRVSNHLVW